MLRDFIHKFRNLEWLPAEYSPYSTPSVGSPTHSSAIACEKALVYGVVVLTFRKGHRRPRALPGQWMAQPVQPYSF